jgi:NitT/TauT family transport system substrate-binding protein
MRFKLLIVLLLLVVSACSGAATTNPAEPTLPVVDEPAAPTAVPATEVPPTPEPITIKMNSSQLTSYAPIFIADAEGFFAEEGITMEYIQFNRSTDAVPLILTGDLDVFAGAINAGILNVLRQEESIRVVADRGVITPQDTCANHGILFRKALVDSGELSGPADLKGRSIATATTGPSAYLLSEYLAQAGLTLNDVVINDVPPAGFIDAMANGTVDAIVAPELRLTQVINSGNAVLGVKGADVYGYLQSSILVFGKNLRVENREAGLRFMRAYMRGIQQYQEGKTDRNVEIMVKYTGETEEIIRQSCWITIAADGRIDFENGMMPFMEWSLQIGDIDAILTEEQFWDPSLLEETLAQTQQ